jgi:hypothetical protein
MLCRTASMEEQIRQPEIRQREIRQREMRQRELYRSKIEKLQKKYSKWHEVYEYDENEMVGFVSGTRIKLWYHPKPIGLIITPDGSVREWTLCDKPWGYEPKFSVPFASEDEIEIRNRDGVTMCRYKRADERDDSEEEEDECEACGKVVKPVYEDEKGGWTIGNCLTCDAMCCRECLSKYATSEDICCVLCTPHK